MIYHRSLLLLFPAALLVALGCSGAAQNPNAPATVTGEIIYKNEKLGGGTITFSSEKGEVTAPISKDGTYVATDMPTGDMTVTIETESVKSKSKVPVYDPAHPNYLQNMNTMMKDRQDDAKYVKIPDKYSNKLRSGLSATLKPGKNIKNFDLE